MNELIQVLLENIEIRKERDSQSSLYNPYFHLVQDKLDYSDKLLQEKFDEQIEKALARIKQKKKDDE